MKHQKCSRVLKSMPDSQQLRPLSPTAPAATPHQRDCSHSFALSPTARITSPRQRDCSRGCTASTRLLPRLHHVNETARAASLHQRWSMLCAKCAKRILHTTYSIERAPQARASDHDGNQTCAYWSGLLPGFYEGEQPCYHE